MPFAFADCLTTRTRNVVLVTPALPCLPAATTRTRGSQTAFITERLVSPFAWFDSH